MTVFWRISVVSRHTLILLLWLWMNTWSHVFTHSVEAFRPYSESQLLASCSWTRRPGGAWRPDPSGSDWVLVPYCTTEGPSGWNHASQVQFPVESWTEKTLTLASVCVWMNRGGACHISHGGSVSGRISITVCFSLAPTSMSKRKTRRSFFSLRRKKQKGRGGGGGGEEGLWGRRPPTHLLLHRLCTLGQEMKCVGVLYWQQGGATPTGRLWGSVSPEKKRQEFSLTTGGGGGATTRESHN